MRFFKFVLVSGIVCFLLGGMSRSNAQQGQESEDYPLLKPGVTAPNFALPTPFGKKLALSEVLKGKKAVLINFWFYA